LEGFPRLERGKGTFQSREIQLDNGHASTCRIVGRPSIAAPIKLTLYSVTGATRPKRNWRGLLTDKPQGNRRDRSF
jgi:hypothetical protein